MEAWAKAALPVIESLAKGGLRVAAGSEKRYCCGFYSRCCRERHLYPSPRHATAAFQQWLLDFVRRRKIDMLFPAGHYGAPAVSEIQDELRRHTLLLTPDHRIFLDAYAKIPTMKAAVAAGVPIPDSWFPHDLPGGLDEVIPLIKSWPVLVKPSIGVGARGIVWCYSADELRRRFEEIERQFGESYVQDFVPPGGMQYKVDMLVDARQRRLAGIVYGKTRMYPPDGGSSVLNFSADRPDILDYAHRVLVHFKWVGFCDFDFVVDPRDNVAKLMEINPRFPESFRMGTSVGIDFPMMLYRLAHGEEVEPVLDYPKNHFLRFLPGDLMWFLRVDNKRRFSTWPSWFKFLDPRTAYQVCSLRDPGPIMGYLLENLAAMLDSSLRRERLRMQSKATPAGRA
jgi:predicted ATP-grasp superfamily ATP-dependent carboligase